MKQILIMLCAALSVWIHSVKATDVLFINPGHSSESFWQDVDSFNRSSAKTLGLTISTYHANRDHIAMIEHLEQRVREDNLPRYILLVNEKQAALKMLDVLENQFVYVQLILNDLTPHQKNTLSPYWRQYLLPSIIPDNNFAGFKTTESLFEKGEQIPGQIAIIAGDRATPASIMRSRGALDFIHLQPKLELTQVIYGDWREKLAYRQTKVLLRRYPELRYVWTANDLMAFGAIRAIEESPKVLGRDIFISTVNTSNRVLKALQEGKVSVLAGGHFAAGGLALFMIQQHAQGKVVTWPVELPLFRLIEPETDLFQRLLESNWQGMSFESLGIKPISVHVSRLQPDNS